MADEQRTSTVAILSVVAAVGGVVASLMGHPYWGMFIGLGAIVLGSLGLGMSASSKVRGGMLSIASIVLGLVGLSLSILVAVGIIVF